MKILVSFLLYFSFVFATCYVSAQQHWYLSVEPGINIATTKLGDAKPDAGFGLEGSVNYRFLKHVYVYGGWSWNKFYADKSFAGNDVDFEESGYTLGLKYLHPIKKSSINYVIEGGGIFSHLEVENNKNEQVADSRFELGCEAGAGLAIALDERFYLLAGFRYHWLKNKIVVAETTTPVNFSYFTINTGVSWSF